MFVRVYGGTGPTDAYLVSHMLERHGLRVKLMGELSTLLAGVPVPEAWPSVWVHKDDERKAEEALQDFNAPSQCYPPWSCASCGESNEPNFQCCWNCDEDRP